MFVVTAVGRHQIEEGDYRNALVLAHSLADATGAHVVVRCTEKGNEWRITLGPVEGAPNRRPTVQQGMYSLGDIVVPIDRRDGPLARIVAINTASNYPYKAEWEDGKWEIYMASELLRAEGVEEIC